MFEVGALSLCRWVGLCASEDSPVSSPPSPCCRIAVTTDIQDGIWLYMGSGDLISGAQVYMTTHWTISLEQGIFYFPFSFEEGYGWRPSSMLNFNFWKTFTALSFCLYHLIQTWLSIFRGILRGDELSSSTIGKICCIIFVSFTTPLRGNSLSDLFLWS